ncbi:MAG: hypothetical protein NVS3B25_32570 [Hymenobacter sp.]
MGFFKKMLPARFNLYECRVNNVPESALETAMDGALKVYQS